MLNTGSAFFVDYVVTGPQCRRCFSRKHLVTSDGVNAEAVCTDCGVTGVLRSHLGELSGIAGRIQEDATRWKDSRADSLFDVEPDSVNVTLGIEKGIKGLREPVDGVDQALFLETFSATTLDATQVPPTSSKLDGSLALIAVDSHGHDGPKPHSVDLHGPTPSVDGALPVATPADPPSAEGGEPPVEAAHNQTEEVPV